MNSSPQRWAVLLRSVNVGGHNTVKMAQLRDALQTAGFDDVQTYIQSGNITLTSQGGPHAVKAGVRTVLADSFAADVPIIVLSPAQIGAMLSASPFEDDGNKIHYFVHDAPFEQTLDFAPFHAMAAPSETLHLAQNALIMHAPDGIARSKLAAKIDTLMPVPVTARNLRTMQKLHEMLRA